MAVKKSLKGYRLVMTPARSEVLRLLRDSSLTCSYKTSSSDPSSHSSDSSSSSDTSHTPLGHCLIEGYSVQITLLLYLLHRQDHLGRDDNIETWAEGYIERDIEDSYETYTKTDIDSNILADIKVDIMPEVAAAIEA
ncbi:hypothetical protein Tco_1349362, partial [Tanacetum coccineum]